MAPWLAVPSMVLKGLSGWKHGLGSLTFEKPDKVKYLSMDLAYAAGRVRGTMTEVSAANEKAVEMFKSEQ